jgi:hypothetical protein
MFLGLTAAVACASAGQPASEAPCNPSHRTQFNFSRLGFSCADIVQSALRLARV